MKENQFFALMGRMKYINRWGLMRNTRKENICEHSLDVAMIAHALGVINNVYFGGSLNADRLAIMGMYHDATEIITLYAMRIRRLRAWLRMSFWVDFRRR